MTDPTSLDSDDLDRLREVAKAATSGPWWVHHANFVARPDVPVAWWNSVGSITHGEFLDSDDAAYVAAFDPPTVLRLLDALAEARRELDRLRAIDHARAQILDGYRRRSEEAEAQAAELEAAVGRVRRRHPRGNEESTFAPGLWCPTCGRERADNGYGACPDRAALFGGAS